MSTLHWALVGRAVLLSVPCGDPVAPRHASFLVAWFVVFWLEVPKIKQGLGHSLADWCFYNLMPECVFHGTRTYGRI